MAKPVSMKQVVQPDPRQELVRRVEDAPIVHADAVLSGYDLLQRLHDTGTLDVLRGALGAGDVLVEHVVALMTAPESVTAIRNVIVLGKILGSIKPEALHAVLEVMTPAAGTKPPSLFSLGRRIAAPDARRGLAAAVSVLEILGKGLAVKE